MVIDLQGIQWPTESLTVRREVGSLLLLLLRLRGVTTNERWISVRKSKSWMIGNELQDHRQNPPREPSSSPEREMTVAVLD